MITKEQFEHIKIGDKFKVSSNFVHDISGGSNLWIVIEIDHTLKGQGPVLIVLENDIKSRRYMDLWNRGSWDVI